MFHLKLYHGDYARDYSFWLFSTDIKTFARYEESFHPKKSFPLHVDHAEVFVLRKSCISNMKLSIMVSALIDYTCEITSKRMVLREAA